MRDLTTFQILVIAAVAFVIGWVCMGLAHGSSIDCMKVKDHDRRQMCLAITKHDKTYCAFIKKPDLRAICYAEVG